jgi:hypothetical protein
MSERSINTFNITSASLVHAYPWFNGMVLSPAKRVFLEQNLQNTSHAKALVDMVLVRERLYPKILKTHSHVTGDGR